MYRLLRNSLTAVTLLTLAVAPALEGQFRAIVTKNVSASPSGAGLSLGFADAGSLDLRLDNGTILVDGSSIGSYSPGSAVDTAWRALLGEAMSLENGALAERLVAWSPPEGLSASAREAAEQIDRALEEALSAPGPAVASVPTATATTDQGALRALLSDPARLGALARSLDGVGAAMHVHVGEDVVIPAGASVGGTLVVVDGSVRIEGEVDGHLVVVDGSVDIAEGGVVRGDVRFADARLVSRLGDIEGDLVDVLEEERDVEREVQRSLRDELRDELRAEMRREFGAATRSDDGGSSSLLSPVRAVVRGVGGVVENLILVFVLALVGAGFLAFAGENLDTIAETARREPGRSAMVGVAGSFLLIPVWILGLIALIVSIVGIPVAIAWAPLFPLAAVLAALLGYLAVAQNAGEWLADSGYPWTGWIRKSNPLYTLVGGLLGLVVAFMAAHVISILPFLDFLGGLLFFVGCAITVVAVQIGFGAVLLTRAGRRRESYAGYDADVAWEAAMRTDLDDELAGRADAGADDA